jgi:hypothetical protein
MRYYFLPLFLFLKKNYICTSVPWYKTKVKGIQRRRLSNSAFSSKKSLLMHIIVPLFIGVRYNFSKIQICP